MSDITRFYPYYEKILVVRRNVKLIFGQSSNNWFLAICWGKKSNNILIPIEASDYKVFKQKCGEELTSSECKIGHRMHKSEDGGIIHKSENEHRVHESEVGRRVHKIEDRCRVQKSEGGQKSERHLPVRGQSGHKINKWTKLILDK